MTTTIAGTTEKKTGRWHNWVIAALVIPTLFPLIAMIPSLLTANQNVINTGIADVLGTGAAIALLLTLLVTPLITVTGQYWLTPLRKWYGRVFFLTAITDAVFAAIYTDFAGNALDKIAGHTFLLVGALMVLIGAALFVTSNVWSQKWLGKWWKTLHKLVYVILFLLLVHMALLFGVLPDAGEPFTHQRFYQILACTILLVVFRLPPVKRWAIRKRKEGDMLPVLLVFIPLFLLFSVSMGFMINELVFKGTTVIMLNPVVD